MKALFFTAFVAVLSAADYDFWACGGITKGWVPGVHQKTSGIHRFLAPGQWDHPGFDHPYIMAIDFDPKDPSTLYMASGNGLIRARNRGQDWRIMTGWDMTEALSVAVDPFQQGRIFLALPDGIGFSEDAGNTWTRRQTGLKRKFTQVIRTDRGLRDHIVTGTESGIFVSANAGQTWQLAGARDLMVFDVQQSPHDPRHWIAVTQTGVAYQSRDNAATWTTIASIPKLHTIYNASFNRKDASQIALGGWTTGVLVTEDGGRNWYARNKGLPTAEVWRIAYHPENGELFAYVHEKELFSSSDNGRTWKPVGLPGGVIRDLVFVPVPSPAKGGNGE